VTLGSDPGDISTIEDEGSVEEARVAWERMRADMLDHHPAEAAGLRKRVDGSGKADMIPAAGRDCPGSTAGGTRTRVVTAGRRRPDAYGQSGNPRDGGHRGGGRVDRP
jgi:hypothetical protein